MNERVPDRYEVLAIGAGLIGVLVAIVVLGTWLAWVQLGSGSPGLGGRSDADVLAGAQHPTSDIRAMLAAPAEDTGLQVEQRFSRLVLSVPQSVCDSFAPADQPDADWHQSAWRASQWECFASFEAGGVVNGGSARAPSGQGYQLFVILRGGERLIHSLRIKLSLEASASGSAGFAHFHTLYGAVAARLGIVLPPVFQSNLDSKDWAQFVHRDFVATWSREYGEPARYDLTIDFAAQGGKYLRLVEEATVPSANRQVAD